MLQRRALGFLNSVFPWTRRLTYINVHVIQTATIHTQSLMYNWRAGASQPSHTTGAIFLYNIYQIRCLSVHPTPCINCGTLYATPVGPRGIPERIQHKLYVYFKQALVASGVSLPDVHSQSALTIA